MEMKIILGRDRLSIETELTEFSRDNELMRVGAVAASLGFHRPWSGRTGFEHGAVIFTFFR